MNTYNRRLFSRRAFLNKAISASALFVVPEWAARAGRPMRIEATRVSGRVEDEKGTGLPGIRVSDGFDVVLTSADGTYSLVSNSTRPFVWISIPDEYQIPVSQSGTARFYARIPRGQQEFEARFRLSKTDSAFAHAFLVLADPQTEDDFEMRRLHDETVPDIRETVSQLGGLDIFGASCGDIMYDNLSLYPQYEEAVRQCGVPFFQVVGNHDLDFGPTDEVSVATFNKHFGPRYYSFDRGEVHYVVLDDVFWYGQSYIGYLDNDQLIWLERDLQTVEDGRTVIVLTHIPLLSTQFLRRGDITADPRTSVSNREAVCRLLEPFNAHVLSGHTHEQEHVFEGGVHEHVHGAVCGAWWSGDICIDGTPNGYSVYEVKGSEIRWSYKATGKSRDYQIRTYGPGSDPSAPDEIVANVFDWDREWSVYWYEDGERRGAMSRRVGVDPLSRRRHSGPTLPTHRPWVEPVRTGHLFYCPAPQDGRRVMIEAIDRWGRSYVSDIPQQE